MHCKEPCLSWRVYGRVGAADSTISASITASICTFAQFSHALRLYLLGRFRCKMFTNNDNSCHQCIWKQP